MDIARLVLDYLEVLIWPITVLAGLAIFRNPIAGLIGRARSAELLGVKAAFDAAKVEAAATVVEDKELDDDDRKRVATKILAPGAIELALDWDALGSHDWWAYNANNLLRKRATAESLPLILNLLHDQAAKRTATGDGPPEPSKP